MKIAVVTPINASGERGGAENLYDGMINALKNSGHDVTQIRHINDESTFNKILKSYCECFYMDLNEYDLVISTKAPTYMVRHPNHISYLLHTIRVFYDQFDKEFNIKDTERQKQRTLIHEFDKYGLDPVRIKKHCVIGHTVAKRMKDSDVFWKGINFEVISPAPMISNFKEPSKGEYIFLPGRLHRWKRVDLVIKSMKYVKSNVDLIIAGSGEDENLYKQLAKDDPRIKFIGWVDDEKLIDLYSKSIVVPFVPINEDFGYVTIEAFKSKKPVITCKDSGEPTYFVKDGFNGFIVEPDPKRIAEKIDYFIENPDETARIGENGYNSVIDITWENAAAKLLKNVEIQAVNNLKPKINVVIIDMQPIEPSIAGGRLRLKGLYSNLGSNIRSLYLGSYDWKGEKFRQINVSDSLLEIDIPLDDEHFRINEHINKLLPGRTIIDVIFPLLAQASPKFVEKVVHEAKKSDVIVLSHPWLYPIIKTEVNLKNKILIHDSQNCEALLREQLLGINPFGKCLSHMVKFVEREVCESSDFIVTCSEDDKNSYVRMFGINPDKIDVFPNGADTTFINPVTEDIRKKNKEKMGITQKTAIFIGSDYAPNVEAGKYIIEKLADQCPEVTFLIVGSVVDKLNTQNKKNIKTVGTIYKEKITLFATADIAICPLSVGSGTSVKMLEYMAAGLPVVSSPVGARGIINEDSYIICDFPDFPKEIRRVLSDDKLYNKLSINSRKLVEKYYDVNKISLNYGKLMTDLYFNQIPYFSVIVPMYRGEHVNRLIEKLNIQTFTDFEVIIVDSGEEREDNLHNICNVKLKYIFKPEIGAAKARNIGIKNARGKIIVFTDDDCQPDADWLEKAKKYFENGNIAGLEGYIYTDETKINDQKFRTVTNKGFEGLGFMTANLFILHEIIEKIGYFDERFDKPHFREDTDLGWRALNYGHIPFAKDVRVFHPPHLRKMHGESKEDRDYFFINDALLFQKHPEKYIQLMKMEGHYKYNKNFWMFFLEGMKQIEGEIPIEQILKNPEIEKYVPIELKKQSVMN